MIPKFTDGFFSVDSENGFLPITPPLIELTNTYNDLQNILDDMSVKTINNTDGYLANNDGSLERVVKSLPNFLDNIKLESDINLIAALYRGYCFLASAYLLEPAHIHFKAYGEYGVGRDRLPSNIAEPLIYLAERLNVFPWLDYSYAYSLGNYVKIDPNGDFNVRNLKMAVSFTGGSDECGFIMDHVYINSHTPRLIKFIDIVLDIVYGEKKVELWELNSNLSNIVDVLEDMNNSRRKMWKVSRHENYNDFRVYIMGITGNTKIFPNGVIYGDEEKPRSYRGQSGSQDTIIPFLDIVFGVDKYYPDNMLTQYLLDMRKYRPKPFRDLLDWCKTNMNDFVDKIMKNGDFVTYRFLFEIYREIYRFRNGHWQFVQKYIMANTKYAVATGGTPITTWIPNQIKATLDAMKYVLDETPIEKTNSLYEKSYNKMVEEYDSMVLLINKQLDELSKDSYDSSKVFNYNKEHNLEDNINK